MLVFSMSLCRKSVGSGMVFRSSSNDLNPLHYAQKISLKFAFSKWNFMFHFATPDIIYMG